jgi:hypothetical protein
MNFSTEAKTVTVFLRSKKKKNKTFTILYKVSGFVECIYNDIFNSLDIKIFSQKDYEEIKTVNIKLLKDMFFTVVEGEGELPKFDENSELDEGYIESGYLAEDMEKYKQ